MAKCFNSLLGEICTTVFMRFLRLWYPLEGVFSTVLCKKSRRPHFHELIDFGLVKPFFVVFCF